MDMIRKLLIVLMMLVVFAPLHAQEIDLCFGLSPEDCAIIGSASANMQTSLTSFTHTFSLDFSLSGMEALGLGEDVSLNIDGMGVFTQADAENVPASLSLTLEGTVGEEDTGVINLRLVDDVLYLQMGDATWQSIAIQEVLESSTFASANLAQLSFGSAETQPNLASSLESIAALLNVPNFIMYERLTDEDGRTPFSFSLDFVPLFGSTEFQQALDQALSLAAQFDPNVESTAMIAPLVLQESDLKVNLTQYADNSVNLVDRLTLTVDGGVDLNTLLGTTEENQVEPITLNIDFDVQLADINQPQTIIVPENAVPVTLSELGLE
jgi:hypothetical protein